MKNKKYHTEIIASTALAGIASLCLIFVLNDVINVLARGNTIVSMLVKLIMFIIMINFFRFSIKIGINSKNNLEQKSIYRKLLWTNFLALVIITTVLILTFNKSIKTKTQDKETTKEYSQIYKTELSETHETKFFKRT